MSDLQLVVARFIEGRGEPLWWPGLAEALLEDFENRHGLSAATYSTTRWLTGSSQEPRCECVCRSRSHPSLLTKVEVLSADVQHWYEMQGHCFWSTDNDGWSAALQGIEAALELVSTCPGVAKLIGSLARQTHLLVPPDDTYDVNFSEPNLPLSVFVSVPRGAAKRVPQRVAEALIHEASHLQLTLVERMTPLVHDGKATHFSPWRQTSRPIGGVLHGLYVFGVVAEWAQQGYGDEEHAAARLSQIRAEVDQVAHLADAPGLSKYGSTLAKHLLERLYALTN